MKHLITYKLFEGQKYIKDFTKEPYATQVIYKPGTYVKFRRDMINGYPIEGISKDIYKVGEVMDNISHYLYGLIDLKKADGDVFNWVKSDDIETYPDIEYAKEMEKMYYHSQKKYNL